MKTVNDLTQTPKAFLTEMRALMLAVPACSDLVLADFVAALASWLCTSEKGIILAPKLRRFFGPGLGNQWHLAQAAAACLTGSAQVWNCLVRGGYEHPSTYDVMPADVRRWLHLTDESNQAEGIPARIFSLLPD